MDNKLIMRYLHSTAIWTAAVSAATGWIGCIVVLLSGSNPRFHVLIAAEAVAAIGVASMLISVFVLNLLTRQRSGINSAMPRLPGDQPAGDGPACSRKRREVLDERLDIDEPHLCSQYVIRCTCWSFCAGSEGESSVGEGRSLATQKLLRVRNLPSEAADLPIVHRNGMDSCPFRFASPLACPAHSDGAALSSFKSDTPHDKGIERARKNLGG